MSRFSWVLISDLHLKSTHTTWSQNVVLRNMVRDIERRKADFANINFVIVSGDLAHAGKPEQYKLVEDFSHRLVGNILIGIVGLNSAMACGNDQDEHNVVLGDRPLVDICEIIREADVRLVIGILHHPPTWLREFDRRTFNDRFLAMCDVIHRGHLHEAEVSLLYTSSNTQCLAVAAGAGYVWRQFKNSYSIVSFDPSASLCLATYSRELKPNS